MTELAWVLLPLLLAAGWVAWRAWRGRPPSRLALNIGVSLLLLIYLSGTAALGIFWVANQHLPVFDWHYLFGYATVLLLVLHLAFNLRIVWNYLRGRPRRAAPPSPPTAPVAGRRRLVGSLGLLGAAFLAGSAFVLGVRHGRTELRTGARSGEGVFEDASVGMALVEQFHEFTAHSRRGLLRRAPEVEWGDPPPPFKRYVARRGAKRQILVPPQSVRPGRAALDRDSLGSVLWHTAGVSLRRGGVAFRSSPSSGALFATELYVAVRGVPGLPPGLWHYDAETHALDSLRDGAAEASELGLPDAALPAEAPAVIVATAVFRRTGRKYRDRCYRYVLADLGHALQNLRVAALEFGCDARLEPWFDEQPVAASLAVDPAEEGVLALAVLMPGARAGESPRAAAGFDAASLQPPHFVAPRGPAAAWRPRPLQDGASASLGLTDAMHRATSLRAAGPLPTTGARVPSWASPGAARLDLPLPLPITPEMTPLAMIERRRSVRRYVSAALTLQELSAALAATGRAPAQLSSALRIDVLTTAVEGLPPAVWRYDPGAHALRLKRRHDGGVRRLARAAALDQRVVGDAAAVIVLSIARDALALEPAGFARGYRHAFLEAGLAGERLYLEGVARGLGVCAVGAFYDDEAAALVDVDAREQWVIHFAAIGRPN
jgi:SagB-type dehydrogenase family enzyme